MKKTLRMLLVLPLLVALMAGCSKPPEMEMAASDQAMQAAQATQASKYAAADWQMANDTLQAAKAESAAQVYFRFQRQRGLRSGKDQATGH